MQLLKNENLLSEFKLICVDDHLDKLPSHIKVVPTVIGKTIRLEAQDIFKWIDQIKTMKSGSKTGMNQPNAPLAFYKQEMTGISDTFGYTTADVDQPHSYQKYDDKESSTIVTGKEIKVKMSKKEQLNKISELSNIRDTEATELKQHHLDSIIAAEQKLNNYKK